MLRVRKAGATKSDNPVVATRMLRATATHVSVWFRCSYWLPLSHISVTRLGAIKHVTRRLIEDVFTHVYCDLDILFSTLSLRKEHELYSLHLFESYQLKTTFCIKMEAEVI